MKWYGWLIGIFCFLPGKVQSSDTLRMPEIFRKLEQVAETDSLWKTRIDVSAVTLTLPQILRNMAVVAGVNIVTEVKDTFPIACHFLNTRLTDLLCFLCRNYGLDVEVTGNIVSVFPYEALPEISPAPAIYYESGLLSLDLKEEELMRVVKEVSALTGLNWVVPPELFSRRVTGYIQCLPPEEAVRILGQMNGFVVKKEVEGFILRQAADSLGRTAFAEEAAFLTIDTLQRITAEIRNENLETLLVQICRQINSGYSFVSPVNRLVSVYVKNISLDDFLEVVFSGTDYSWKKEGNTFLFGTPAKEGDLSETRLFALKCRTADKVKELIPESLKKDLQIQLFPDLNSLIITGESRRVNRVVRFLEEIDQRVPLITIDVIIVDATRSTIREAGITAGLGNAPEKTSGTLSPGINMAFNAASINKLINSFNGFGSMNLGKVTPDFYLNLKFLEEAGDIELRSTPRLATLNGHEATLSSGETKYYKEIANNIIGTQNPIQSESYTWKDVEAKLSIRIVPFVTMQNSITLEIEIEQSEFTDREEKEAPPGKSTRSFKSVIKVQNEEMVLLGGIEKNSRTKTSRGLPFIARIPVLKWLFGSSVNNKVTHKLNVFIKPTVVL